MNSTVSLRSIAFPALDSITSGRPQVVSRQLIIGAITRVRANSIGEETMDTREIATRIRPQII